MKRVHKEDDGMAWYDGTDDYSLEELEKEYPVAVTSNL